MEYLLGVLPLVTDELPADPGLLLDGGERKVLCSLASAELPVPDPGLLLDGGERRLLCWLASAEELGGVRV